jgi:prepilin-type N-terminal cleavage/methylation domain-containing protein
MSKTHQQRGFTLVELLATMAIIAILAAAMVSAMSQAKESAKKMRTRQLIAKLHEQMMPRWESFQTRRLPVTVPLPPSSSNMPLTGFPLTTPQNPYVQAGIYGRAVAWFRLWAMRELIRMEMPDRYTDLTFTPKSLINQVTVNGQPQTQPFISDQRLAYLQRAASQIGTQTTTLPDLISSKLMTANGPAECLYLITSVGATDQDLYGMTFSPTDWGDTDNDGMPEFIDAWGNPISFVRWPSGFVSDLQPVFSVAQGSPGYNQLPPGLPPDPKNPNNVLTHFPVEVDNRVSSVRYLSLFNFNDNHDAFDPLEVDPNPLLLRKTIPERGYNLIPLIYSAGPNGSLYDILNGTGLDGYGITTGLANSSGGTNNDTDPYAFYPISGQNIQRGAISDNSAYDNIHNHLIGQ